MTSDDVVVVKSMKSSSGINFDDVNVVRSLKSSSDM